MSKAESLQSLPIVEDLNRPIQIPIVSQATDYTCGVAALLAVLYYWDSAEDQYEICLASRLGANTRDGVVSARIVKYAKSHGFHTIRKENMALEELKGYIRNGKPVLVLLQAWRESPVTPWKQAWKDGHFSVAIGYDSDKIYFMDPSTLGNYTYIPTKEFLDRWHDYDGKVKVHNLGIVIWKKRRSFDSRMIKRMR